MSEIKKSEPHSNSFRMQCWTNWNNSNPFSHCFCCSFNSAKKVVRPDGKEFEFSSGFLDLFSHIQVFELGWIVSKYNGGEMTVSNVVPVCLACSKLLGDHNMAFVVSREKFKLAAFMFPGLSLIQRGLIDACLNDELVRDLYFWVKKENFGTASDKVKKENFGTASDKAEKTKMIFD